MKLLRRARHAALALTVVVWWSACALSQASQAPSPTQIPGGQQQDERGLNQQGASESRGPSDDTVSEEKSAAERSDAEDNDGSRPQENSLPSDEDWKPSDIAAYIQAGAAVLTLIAAIAALFIYKWQWEAMEATVTEARHAAQATDRTVKLTNRARIMLSKVESVRLIDSQTNEAVAFEFRAVLKNYGPTEAVDLACDAKIVFLPPDQVVGFELRSFAKDPPGTVLPGAGEIARINPVQASIQQTQQIMSGELAALLCVDVLYRDILDRDKQRVTRLCARLVPRFGANPRFDDDPFRFEQIGRLSEVS